VADSHSAEAARVSSHLLYKLGLTRHLTTVINCTVLHAARRGGWEMSQRQQPVKHCTAVGSCMEDKLACITLPD